MMVRERGTDDNAKSSFREASLAGHLETEVQQKWNIVDWENLFRTHFLTGYHYVFYYNEIQ